MAITITENIESRPFNIGFDNSSRSLVYDIQGTDDELAVQATIAGTAPATYQGLVLSNIEATYVGDQVWKGFARYSVFDVQYTFDTTGGTRKVMQSLATINAYVPSSASYTAPNFNGAINVSSEGIEGVEDDDPKFDFTETHLWDDADITPAYKKVLRALTGCVNNAPFKDWDIGEVKFRGETGGKRGNERWTLTYRFSSQPNLASFNIGGMTIDKAGWDYFWMLMGEQFDPTGFCRVPVPLAGYVERISIFADFSQLLIGV
jgi:hypothetical protein